MNARIHSIQSLGAVDGPGIRTVVFMQGCPYACLYCHNPETWAFDGGTAMTVEEVLVRIVRNRPYFGRDGGVTISGGEPLFMAPFVRELFLRARDLGIHTCLDTSGALLNDDIRSLLLATDLCLLDIKATDGPGYSALCGIDFDAPLAFLKELDNRGVPTWIRQVIVPGINDTADCVRALNAVIAPFSCVTKVELLPFHNMCIETYRRLGLPFPLSDTKPMNDAALAGLSAQIVLP